MIGETANWYQAFANDPGTAQATTLAQIDAYRQALVVRADHAPTHGALIELHLSMRDTAAAQAHHAQGAVF